MPIFGYDRAQAEKRFGHPSQIGGLKLYTLTDGRANGIRAVDFRTNRGLNFTVLLDRGMDISEARYKGASLCWRSASGDVAPSFYEPRGLDWLWTFYGGLLTTCGLTQVGPPHEDGNESLGLHGRISTAPTEQVCVKEEWGKDHMVMEVSGLIREARLFGPQLEMRRTIRARNDCASFIVRDNILNAGPRTTPFMLLYHINTGFPLLDDRSELILPSLRATPRDAEAEEGKEQWAQLHAPISGYKEKVYFHTMRPSADGQVTCALINRRLGIGLRMRYSHAELPFFTQWKMLGEREYVLGLEPGNCKPIGRVTARETGELVELAPGQAVETGFEIEVVEGEEALEQLGREAASK